MERKPINRKALKRHKKELPKKIKGLRCRLGLGGSTLICRGNIQPEYCHKYSYEIIYYPGSAPRFYIRSPHIASHPDIHRYKDGALCLFYPLDYTWTDNQSIFKVFFPWFVEWILYYEHWKISGVWMGNEVNHNTMHIK